MEMVWMVGDSGEKYGLFRRPWPKSPSPHDQAALTASVHVSCNRTSAPRPEASAGTPTLGPLRNSHRQPKLFHHSGNKIQTIENARQPLPFLTSRRPLPLSPCLSQAGLLSPNRTVFLPAQGGDARLLGAGRWPPPPSGTGAAPLSFPGQKALTARYKIPHASPHFLLCAVSEGSRSHGVRTPTRSTVYASWIGPGASSWFPRPHRESALRGRLLSQCLVGSDHGIQFNKHKSINGCSTYLARGNCFLWARPDVFKRTL